MAKDPAFLFYPGDYLKDTQCLSEQSQVAYDRIMCEHMRNICVSQQQLNFFIKRLTDDEKSEVMSTLKEVNGGFEIEWVAESICKRRAYSKSRAQNRKGKTKNISSTYDNHMENANENANEDVIENKNESKSVEIDFSKPDIPGDYLIFPMDTPPVRKLWAAWKRQRWLNHHVRYKMMAEQADLKRLEGLTFSRIQETIQAGIGGSWKNLYPENTHNNGKSKSISKKQEHLVSLVRSYAERWGADANAE